MKDGVGLFIKGAQYLLIETTQVFSDIASSVRIATCQSVSHLPLLGTPPHPRRPRNDHRRFLTSRVDWNDIRLDACLSGGVPMSKTAQLFHEECEEVEQLLHCLQSSLSALEKKPAHILSRYFNEIDGADRQFSELWLTAKKRRIVDV